MQKRLNVRLLVRAAAAVTVVATVVHLVHGFQVGRQSRDYLRAAEEALAANDPTEALTHLGRYLVLRPGDVGVQVKYGLLLERLATTDAARRRAYRYLEQVVRGDPDNVRLRQTLGHLAVKLGRFKDAARHLERLRGADVDRAELEQTLAWCHLGSGDNDQAVQCFTSAIRLAPRRVINYVQLAELWLRLDQPGQARRVMDDLIAANRDSAEAFAARSRYFQATGRPDDAASDVARALRLAPASADILLQAAELAVLHDSLKVARQLLQRGITTHPRDLRFPLALARLQADTGHEAEAVAVLRRAGEAPEVLTLLGELLFEKGDAGAEAVLDRLRRVAPPGSPWVGYLEAQSLARRGDWVAAARRFEALLAAGARGPSPLQARLWLGLARCYEACGDARRLEACRRAVSLEPSRRALLALVEALTAAGQAEEAAREGKRLMKRPEAPARGWLAWTEALIRRNAGRAKGQADWTEPGDVLLVAECAGADPVRVVLLWAEVLVGQGHTREAGDLLRSQAAEHPAETALAAGLADLARRDGDPREGLRLLAEARARPGAVDGADWRLAQIRCVLAAGTFAEAGHALEEAGRGMERLPADTQRRVFQALVAALRQRGEGRAATEVCRRWCRRLSNDLAARLVLFDLLIAAGEGSPGEVLADMRRIEGDRGVCWRCGEVMRLLIALENGGDRRQALSEAHKRLDEAARLQPRLGRVAALRARLDEIEGRPDQALDNYSLAFQQGDRDEGLAERLVQLLLNRQRYRDAARVVSVYQQDLALAADNGRLTDRLARLGCEAALRLRDFSRAAELARLAVPANARDHRDHLWLANVLETAGRPDEAGRVLERLTQTSGDIADTWVALLRHLARLGKWKRVEEVLEKAIARLDGVGQARCYEAAARIEEAERAYVEALKAAPGDSLLRRDLARFYLLHDQPEQALSHLRLLASAALLPEHAAWARRMLATLSFQLVVLGRLAPDDRRPVTEAAALRLLGRNRTANAGSESVADQRARALVVAADRDRVGEALRLFEATLPGQPLTPDEQFRLAQLYDLAGNAARADGLMLALLNDHPQNAQYLAGQVRLLLAQGDRPGARRWLKRLEKVEPDTPRTRSLRERLR